MDYLLWAKGERDGRGGKREGGKGETCVCGTGKVK